jgi:hypothetical protein
MRELRWGVRAIGIATLGFLMFPVSAEAATPTKSTINIQPTGTLPGVCSFPIDIRSTITGTEIDYVDTSGNPTAIYIHATEQDTFTGPGAQLESIPYTYNVDIKFDSQGNLISVYSEGVVVKVVLPDGSMFLSAGRVNDLAHQGVPFVLSPDTGRSGNLNAFCAALVSGT